MGNRKYVLAIIIILICVSYLVVYKSLLSVKSHPEDFIRKGYTAIAWEASNNIEKVKMLIEYGVDINYQHAKSETALTVAAKGCRNFELVALLLDNGANPNLIDEFGHTTKTGLSRYCGDKEQYKRMMALIEQKERK